MRTTLEEGSLDITVAGVDISFDIDFIIANMPNDTYIEMIDNKDKDEMLSTAVYYSQSVVLPFLVTAFFSLTLFLAYCCKSRCFVIFSRIFLIILIIIFLLVAVSFPWNGCKRSIGDFSPNSFFSELGDFGLPSCDSASWETSFFFSLTLIRGLRPPEPPLTGGSATRTPLVS